MFLTLDVDANLSLEASLFIFSLGWSSSEKAMETGIDEDLEFYADICVWQRTKSSANATH